MEDELRQELDAAMVTIEALKQRLVQKEFEIVDLMAAVLADQAEQQQAAEMAQMFQMAPAPEDTDTDIEPDGQVELV